MSLKFVHHLAKISHWFRSWLGAEIYIATGRQWIKDEGIIRLFQEQFISNWKWVLLAMHGWHFYKPKYVRYTCAIDTYKCYSKSAHALGNGCGPHDGMKLLTHSKTSRNIQPQKGEYLLANEFMWVHIRHYISMVSCQKGPIRHAYAWQIGPFWQDTLDILAIGRSHSVDIGVLSTRCWFVVWEQMSYQMLWYSMPFVCSVCLQNCSFKRRHMLVFSLLCS